MTYPEFSTIPGVETFMQKIDKANLQKNELQNKKLQVFNTGSKWDARVTLPKTQKLSY